MDFGARVFVVERADLTSTSPAKAGVQVERLL